MKLPPHAVAGDWIVVAVCPRCQGRTICGLAGSFSVETVEYIVGLNLLDNRCGYCGRKGLDTFVAGRVDRAAVTP